MTSELGRRSEFYFAGDSNFVFSVAASRFLRTQDEISIHYHLGLYKTGIYDWFISTP